MTAAAAWTCPFCPLACDHFGVRVGRGAAPQAMVARVPCARPQRGLAAFASEPVPAAPHADGRDCTIDEALAAAARHLSASRQPLFAHLATDVAGARALYRLACAHGAICDGSAASVPLLRALQDAGQFTTTLAEVRTRADVIVFVGGLPLDEAPLIAQRCGIGESQAVAQRHVVALGPRPGDDAALAAWAGPAVSVETIALHDDLFTTLALLSAPQAAAGALAALADRLARARYAVLVGSTSALPLREGALAVEAVHRIVRRLNESTRAAALWIGGSTANAVFTWLSGLPLRSRCSANDPPEHEPWLFDSERLLRMRAVDALLWVSSFEPLPPPAFDGPTVVLGPPSLSEACRRHGTVFIPAATPGVGSEGHLFRTDGTVLMPLHAVRTDGLPGVAQIARRLLELREGVER
jgi:formylmethanofuran dehydrogenase subunit B